MGGVYTMKQGDLEPLEVQLTDRDGPVPLFTAESATFLMGPAREGVALPDVTGGMEIMDDGTEELRGWARYRWIAGETDTPGAYRVTFRVVYADGIPKSFPHAGYEDLIIEALPAPLP